MISNHLEELTNVVTHIPEDGSPSCLDLICTDQPYISTDTGVLPSPVSHSKHNIIPGSLTFILHVIPHVDEKFGSIKLTDLIRTELLSTNWQYLFLGLDANEMSIGFTNTLHSIFSRHISN